MTAVLAHSPYKGFCPVEFECFELQRIQPEQQFPGPLKTEATLSRAGVDKEVLKARWPDDLPLALQFSPRRVGAPSDLLGLLWPDVWRKCSDSISQCHVIRRRGEDRFFAAACTGQSGAICQDEQCHRPQNTKAQARGAEGHYGLQSSCAATEVNRLLNYETRKTPSNRME